MKNLSVFLTEKKLGELTRSVKFDITFGTTTHAEERLTRHGTDEINRIDPEEIKELIRKCSEQIIDGLVYNKIQMNVPSRNRFCIQDSRTELNVVGGVTGYLDKDTISISIITVYRGAEFRNDEKRTYTIKI